MEWVFGVAVTIGTFAAQLWLGRKVPRQLQEQLDSQDKDLAEIRADVALARENAESANRKNARIEAHLNITPSPLGEDPRTASGPSPLRKKP